MRSGYVNLQKLAVRTAGFSLALLMLSNVARAQSVVTFSVTGNFTFFSYAPESTISIDTSTGLVTASDIVILPSIDYFTLSNLTTTSPTEIIWANSDAYGSLLIKPFPPGFIGFTGGPVQLAEYIPDLATAYDSLDTTLTPISPQEVITAMQAYVNTLFSQGVLNSGQDNSLVKQLQHVLKLSQAGKNNGAVETLQGLIAEVNDLLASGVLSQSQADALIRAVTSLIATLRT